MALPEPASPAPEPARAPANGLKLMLLIVIALALVAAWGQWQHFHRAKIESVTVLRQTGGSPAATPTGR